MDILDKLNAAVSSIERDLCGEIDIERAARIACTSVDGFARFFGYMTGMTLTEYVRRRRLSLAADDVMSGGERVIDIAVKYGYNSADSFTRAFAKQHGITPSALRKTGGSIRIYPPASFHITIKGAKEMDFRIINAEKTVVYGVSREFDRSQFPTREALRHTMWSEEWDNVPGRICAGKWNQPWNTSYDGVWYGVWRGDRYMIARELGHVCGDSLEELTIPPGRYAVFTTEPGGLAWEELPKLFELIFDSWLPSSGYEHTGGDIIEVYHLWTDHDTRKKNRYYEVMIPVRRK